MKRYVLFEHASGYAIFKVIAHEEVGALLEEVQRSICELDRFGKVTKLIAYAPFSSALTMLDNALAIAEGQMSEDLLELIRANVRSSPKVSLGVSDPRLGSVIHDKLGITCVCNEVIHEITRGIRTHFHKFIQDMNLKSALNAQLGLGHSVSRSKIKYNVNKADNMIIQASSLLEQLDKDVNTFSMRIREWYAYHFPELFGLVKDNQVFAKAAHFIGDRRQLSKEHLPGLVEIVGNMETATAILDAAKTSMGMDISDIDLINIKRFSLKVVNLSAYRQKLFDYLMGKMKQIAPNLSSVIGEVVGAKLICQAGSMINLAKYPASTVQILGAEKALFRALKTRGKTPKYGIIYHSSFIGRAPIRSKGRISRFLAHKCSIASRLDCFSENPCNIVGTKLHEQIEDRLQYYIRGGHPENGDIPKSNAEVMEEAVKCLKERNRTLMEALAMESSNLVGKLKRKKIKNKKHRESLSAIS